MAEILVPIIAMLSIFVALPVIIAGATLGRRFLKIKERELEIRREELDVERERVTVMRLLGNEKKPNTY